ncbi:hypothetical protein B296_00008640 [Ensete ventricosum]|uniref:Uncharacterized protein n=1 Tax=Ensete ventricosum TaxID=4639 RepID=A0A427A8A7_ENSVE|nr:hypothetical protein B296_00008640 [Ensete ventricosum]
MVRPVRAGATQPGWTLWGVVVVLRLFLMSDRVPARKDIVGGRASDLVPPMAKDSRSVVVVSSFGVGVLGDFGTVDVLAAMRSCFNVDSTMTTRRLVEMFNLGKMKSGRVTGNGSIVLSPNDSPAVVEAASSAIEKHPDGGEGLTLRKHLRKATPEQPANTIGSSTKSPVDKGKNVVEVEEAPERGYTNQDLCEVEDRAGVDKYFASIMMRLKPAEGEDPLVARWSTISGSSQVWTDGPLSGEYLQRGLLFTLAKQVYECPSEELMDRAGKSAVWLEIGVLPSSLDGAQVNQARLEGDVLSLTEATTFLEVELKGEGPKVVATYKASRGFESSLEKMGRVSYEFEYRVTLEQLWEKHPEIVIEQDPFVEYPEDVHVKMDLNQPFDDNTPSEK